MNPAQLLAHFDRISEAPDAIPRLRQFVLELAVRGKLVDRDPKDEHASEFLKRVHAEKERRTKEGNLKRQVLLPQVRPEEAWFGIPASWRWVRLGTITQVDMGQSPPGHTYNKTGDGVPLINGPAEFTEGPFGKTVINQYTTAPTNLCEEGDLLLCVRGSTTGRTNIAGFRACIGRGVAAIRPFFSDEYIRLFIWRLRASIIAMGRGIAFPSVSRQQIEELPVPLPPLAEQHRIVAKVDELMALCDRLEAAQVERESRRDRLAAASLQRLNQGAADESTFREHTRFHFNHLPRLTTKSEHIHQLRQTILNLAVCGKLVPQDLSDEPASELLKRIQAETTILPKKVVVNDEPPLSPTMPEVLPFDIPVGWTWVRLQQLLEDKREISYGVIKLGDEPKTGGVYTLRCSDVKPRLLNLANVRKVAEEIERNYLRTRLVGGEILLNIRGTLGGVALVPSDLKGYNVAREVAVIPISRELSGEYLVNVMASPYFWQEILKRLRGIAYKGLNLKLLRLFDIPLPPLAEQHRIVAKVEELMSLCDQLEARLTTAQTESRRLLEAVLHEALAPVA